ncbi:hypothetical protein RB6712 [Rhodopirellula baltica SH 1]|uniref:Uncharacterized protein n=1 Tax=Rhodopirellula baltica (strain DSM 10527 / NCIMB 13988 / SH1) TaxID=243090 RepID=Q7UPU6_RHOBA|nr:hypothetical protein RB6712 [Rhodopirellula baltica SH 1]
MNLAVGQDGAVFFRSRGDAPGYVERGRWPFEKKRNFKSHASRWDPTHKPSRVSTCLTQPPIVFTTFATGLQTDHQEITPRSRVRARSAVDAGCDEADRSQSLE